MLQRFGALAPVREVKFARLDLKRVDADGTFSGYASPSAKKIWAAMWSCPAPFVKA